MNIISPKEEVNRMVDGMHTILNLPEEKYNLFIEEMTPKGEKIESLRFFYLTDGCEIPQNPIQIGLEQTYDENQNYIGRGYFGGTNFSMHKILEYCKSMLNSYPADSLEYSKISTILHTRDLDSFIASYSSKENIKSKLLDKIFEILSNDDMLSKFLDYSNNTEIFAIDGIMLPIKDYLEPLGKIFGNKDKSGNLSNSNSISKDFFIPDLEEFKNRYLQILNTINMDRYVNPDYTFSGSSHMFDTIVRNGDEPDWNIDSKIHQEIFDNMPQNLSLEEQAMYIYCKMCIMFYYDEGYSYKDKLNKVNYESTFSKEHLEGLKIGSKITCYDFSRMYAKLLNELDGDITAVMILNGANEGHALVGFYTEKVSATAEAINVDSNKDSTNDLMKAKNGINLKGIKIISDREGILKQATDKVYKQILGKNPKSIKEYIQELKGVEKEQDIPNDVALKLQCLLEVMRANNISGNEFTQTLWGVSKSKYFGDSKLEKAYLGELQKDEKGSQRYKRHILLRNIIQEKGEDSQRKEVYMIDTDTLELTTCTEEQIIAKLNSGELIYENEKHKLPGIDKEVSQ